MGISKKKKEYKNKKDPKRHSEAKNYNWTEKFTSFNIRPDQVEGKKIHIPQTQFIWKYPDREYKFKKKNEKEWRKPVGFMDTINQTMIIIMKEPEEEKKKGKNMI